MSTYRDLQTFMAKVANQAERYEDGIAILKNLVKQDPKLSSTDRDLLYVAYKKLASKYCQSLRFVDILSSTQEITQIQHQKLQDYYKVILEEFNSLSNDLITMIDNSLLPADNDPRAQVFYEKLKGDFYRDLAQFKTGEEKHNIIDEASKSYKRGMEIGKHFEKSDSLYLNLMNNYTIFLYEVKEAKEEAISLAEETFNNAVEHLNSLDNDDCCIPNDTMTIQIINDNIKLWKEN